MHYLRVQTKGDVGTVESERIYGDEATRFWPKVDKNGPVPEYAPHLGPCWVWTKTPNADGYGQFRGSEKLAHRMAYVLEVGPIPEGLTIDHLCRVRICVNPSHLEPVTQQENSRRGQGNHYAVATHCIHGHPFDEANTYRYFNKSTGKVTRSCRTCGRERMRARRHASSTD